MTRFHYAETVDELQRRLDNGTATPTDWETARVLSMEPSSGSVAAKSHHPYTSYKDMGRTGGQWSLEQHTAKLNRLSAEMVGLAADKQQRAEKARAYGDELPPNQQAQMIRSNRESQDAKPKNRPRYSDPAMQTAHELTRNWPGSRSSQNQEKKPTAQRPPAKKEQGKDPYIAMAEQLTGTWPATWPGPMGYKQK